MCLIDRDAANIALNATGQDGINMETLYQASKEQTWGFVTTCTRQVFMRIVSSSIFIRKPAVLGPWYLARINAQSEAGTSVIVHMYKSVRTNCYWWHRQDINLNPCTCPSDKHTLFISLWHLDIVQYEQNYDIDNRPGI